MIEKLRKIRDEKRYFEAVLTGLSETFDCILREKRIAKLRTARFDIIQFDIR